MTFAHRPSEQRSPSSERPGGSSAVLGTTRRLKRVRSCLPRQIIRFMWCLTLTDQIETLSSCRSEIGRPRHKNHFCSLSRRSYSRERAGADQRLRSAQYYSALANFTLKLARPGSARQPSCLLHRQRDGVTAVAVRDSVLRTSCAATAAPLCHSHAGPAVQLTPRTLGRRTETSRGGTLP